MKKIEGNKIIAAFDGKRIGLAGDITNGDADFHAAGLKYHSSWDWLMPAWVKFVVKYHELGRRGIYPGSRKLRSEFHDASDKGDIASCWEILTTGIQWYNNQAPQP